MDLGINLIRKLTGIVCLLIGVAMIPCALISLIFKEFHILHVFLGMFGVLAVLGFLLFFPIRKTTHVIKTREAFFIVSICWILAAVLSAIPFLLTGAMTNFFDAFFEAVSGITTTGANIIGDVSSLPKGIVFWRSFINWIGGMGILLFAISILPAMGIGTAHLINAETVGSSIDKYKMRISENAKSVYLLYISLSLIEFVSLFVSGMNWFDAMLNTFSSISNSGISVTSDETIFTNSLSFSLIIAVFCIIGAINFSTLQHIPRRRFKEFFKDPEIIVFFMLLFFVLILIICVLWAKGVYGGLGETIRGCFLQTVAFVTTAGYNVSDYNNWPVFCKMILFFFSFIGGCSASTAGGIKISRFIAIIMLIRRNFYKRLHPNAVVAVKIGDRTISADKVSNVVAYVFVYISVFVFGSLLLSLDGQSIETTMSSVIGALSNTGLNFDTTSLHSGFAVFSSAGRFLLSVLMLLGRIEIIAILILFTSTFWKGNR